LERSLRASTFCSFFGSSVVTIFNDSRDDDDILYPYFNDNTDTTNTTNTNIDNDDDMIM